MKCFYHATDLDGRCSAAIVRAALPNVELLPINHGDEFPWGKIRQNETIYMVDFCLAPFEKMERLNDIANLIWIDHHASSIEMASERNFRARGGQSLDTQYAACELVWKWFFPEKSCRAVHLLGRYDVYDLIPDSVELQNGLRLHDTNPENNELWEKVFSDDAFLDECVKNGRILLRQQEMLNESYAKNYAFETVFEGLNVIAMNGGMKNALAFKSVYDPQKHDAMLSFAMLSDGRWNISLYAGHNTSVDVGSICRKRGGGGHRGAGAFQCGKLPPLHGNFWL